MTPRTSTVLCAFALALGTLAPKAARAAACGDILTANTVLTAPLACVGDALAVGADNILLNCNGFSLTGDGTGIGVLLDGRTGVRVKNCPVSNFAVGILLTGSSANHLTLNGVTDSTSVGNGGIQLSSGSDGNVVELNRSYNNSGRGFAITDSVGNLMRRNSSANNGFRGFDLIDASGNALIRNGAFNNASGGVVVSGTSAGNILHDNTVTNSGSEGFAMFSATNYLSFNASDGNGTWGINDTTGANLYLFDTCVGNGSGPSSPAGLCL